MGRGPLLRGLGVLSWMRSNGDFCEMALFARCALYKRFFRRGSVVRGIDAEDWRSCRKARDLFYGGSLREFEC
jgi:hypothetical protein